MKGLVCHTPRAALFLSSLLTFTLANADCPPLSSELLNELVKKSGSKRLVFFSTWCSECKDHVKRVPSAGTLFIAAFDKAERAEAALRKLGRTEPCYVDNGLTKKFGINVVPAEKIVEP